MLRRVFFKLLGERKRDYLRVILSGSFIIALVYFSSSVAGCLVYVAQRKTATMTYLVMEVEKEFLIPYILLLFLMFLILIGYIRKRAEDYSMLTVLGIQKKHRRRFVGFEYLGIVLGSLGGGLILGSIGSEIIRKILERVFADIVEEIRLGTSPLKLTLIIGVMVFVFGFILCDQLISCMGLDYVVSMGRKSGKAIRTSRIFSVLAVIILLGSVITVVTYWGRLNYTVPSALSAVALILIILFWGGYYLYRLRIKKKKYFRKILWMDDWYHQFYHHANVSYIVAAFFLIASFWFNLTLIGHLPVAQEENYPYDLVWGANEEDMDFLEGLEEKYQVQFRTVPSIRVSAGDAGEHMGISASVYEELTGEKIKLGEKEIFVVYQEDRSERGTLGLDYVRTSPRIYLGASDWDIWPFAGLRFLPAAFEFTNEYTVAESEYRILTGNFRTRVSMDMKDYGLYSDIFEEIVVFSDEEFGQISESARGSDLTVLMDIPKNYQEVTEEVYAYATEHSQVNFFDHIARNLIYEKKVEQVIDREEKLLNACSMLINIVTLLACMIFTLLETAADDYENLEWKSRFYCRSGLGEKKRKQVVCREVMLTVKAALVAAVPVSLLLSVTKILYMKMDIVWTGIYLLEVAGMITGISVILLLAMRICAGKYYGKIERKIRNE